jgi:hypothetical protein
MKVTIPNNTWVSSVDLTYCREGFWNGAMMLMVSLTGTALDFEFITELFEKLLKLSFPKRKIVRFSGMMNPNDANLDTIIRAFRTYGFMVQVVTNGTRSYTWSDAVDWHIIQTEKPIVLLDCQELWYSPAPIDPIPEPQIALSPGKNIFLYLAKGHSVSSTNDFIVQSKNNWNLL